MKRFALTALFLLVVVAACGTLQKDNITSLSAVFNAKAPSVAIITADGEDICVAQSPNDMTKVVLKGYKCTKISDADGGTVECLVTQELAKLQR